ncbi:hypothetical protein B0T19DRAFT_259708 [Cercophora scortea]|uniref:Uncharacterized protein n=1 Tax=Cercophora scortea TaxID=314031 RepID=A0AAE0I9Q6_9PEZI|nr:hypothetical protein B0T19DRAFT_259708 [Cercophora scortea]
MPSPGLGAGVRFWQGARQLPRVVAPFGVNDGCIAMTSVVAARRASGGVQHIIGGPIVACHWLEAAHLFCVPLQKTQGSSYPVMAFLSCRAQGARVEHGTLAWRPRFRAPSRAPPNRPIENAAESSRSKKRKRSTVRAYVISAIQPKVQPNSLVERARRFPTPPRLFECLARISVICRFIGSYLLAVLRSTRFSSILLLCQAGKLETSSSLFTTSYILLSLSFALLDDQLPRRPPSPFSDIYLLFGLFFLYFTPFGASIFAQDTSTESTVLDTLVWIFGLLAGWLGVGAKAGFCLCRTYFLLFLFFWSMMMMTTMTNDDDEKNTHPH